MTSLIGISAILFFSSTKLIVDFNREIQLRIDQEKARYLAQAGIMKALYDWYTSNAAEFSRQYTGIQFTMTGNNQYLTETTGAADQGPAANYAYFSFNNGETAETTTLAGRIQLRRWRMLNIRTNDTASTNDNIRPSSVRVSWIGSSTAMTWRRLVVQKGTSTSATTTLLAAAARGNGTDYAFNVTAAPNVLAPGEQWQSTNTYIEWTTNYTMPSPVSVKWTFSDNSTTKDSTTHEVIFWSGGAPTQHTFCITSTGMVNQTTNKYFKVLKTLKATVSGTPASPEIIDIEEVDKNFV